MNIFNLSDQNSENLKQCFCSLEENYKDETEKIEFDQFNNIVLNNWKISINMRQSVLNNVLIAGKYKNIYEIRKEIEQELKKVMKLDVSVEQSLHKHLKNHYKSRITFDRTFKDGEMFKYGALNIGGLGVKKYGEYCVVIRRDQTDKNLEFTFIKEDSLNYVEGNNLNVERLRKDIANRDCVHLLLTIKHENDIKEKSENEWMSMICCDDDYIEAVTKDDILNECIECVRMSEKEHKLYYNNLFKEFSSELSDIEKYRLGDFKNMQVLLNKQGIKLEIINENGN